MDSELPRSISHYTLAYCLLVWKSNIRGLAHEIIKMEIQNDASTSESTTEGESGRMKLKVVVQACEKQWFEEYLAAAEQGVQEMQILVGQMFRDGYGVERDPAKALYWFGKAEKNGNVHLRHQK